MLKSKPRSAWLAQGFACGLALTIGMPLGVNAQATTCATPAGVRADMLGRVRNWMVSPSPAMIASLNASGIPIVSDTTQIVWVTDKRICDKVRTAYAAYLVANGSPRAVGAQVFVVKVGSVYVVQDTFVSPSSEFTTELVMDKKYQVLSARMS